MIEEIKCFEFVYRPFDDNYPIRACTVTIYAKDRKTAEMININNNYKFFDQDCTCTVIENPTPGYRKLK